MAADEDPRPPDTVGASEPPPHGLVGGLERIVEAFALRILKKDAERGAAHDALDPQVGDWAGTMTTWLAPGQPSNVEQVTSRARWILEGRFLERTFDGRFLGRPFSALCLTGYDDAAARYVATWMDSATTAMLSFTGSLAADARVLTLDGSMKLVAIPGATVDVRSVLTMDDAAHLRQEISIGRLGIRMKAHEIELTRTGR